MRLFISISTEEHSEYFNKLKKEIESTRINANFTNAFHLTLKFLGEVDEANTERIMELLHNINSKKFSLTLSKLGMFPNENYIRVLWHGIERNDKLLHLQNEIDTVLLPLFKKDEKFHPHVTLARVKNIRNKYGFLEEYRNIQTETLKIEVTDFRLVRSTLTSEGPIYEDLEIFSLG